MISQLWPCELFSPPLSQLRPRGLKFYHQLRLQHILNLMRFLRYAIMVTQKFTLSILIPFCLTPFSIKSRTCPKEAKGLAFNFC